jgi:hypothetical protein
MRLKMNINLIKEKLKDISLKRKDSLKIDVGGCFDYYMNNGYKNYLYFNSISFYGNLGFKICITDLKEGFNPLNCVYDYIIKHKRNIKHRTKRKKYYNNNKKRNNHLIKSRG